MNAPDLTRTAAAQRTLDGPSELERLLQGSWSPRDMLEGDSMDKMLSMAEHLAKSKVSVPDHLKNNIGDCLAIVTQAMLWNMNPFAVAQKTHIVSGKLGYEAQLVNAVVQNSGAVRGAPHYEYRGEAEALECRVGFVLRGESDVAWNEWYCIAKVVTRNSSLWKTNPRQQLGYLQLKNWARAFCPGAILGVYTVDELEQGDADGVVAAPAPRRADSPAAAPTAPTLPPYSPDAFAKNKPAWIKLIADGKKTPAELLATLSTKAVLSEEQRAAVLALGQPAAPAPAADPAPPPADDGGTWGDDTSATAATAGATQ